MAREQLPDRRPSTRQAFSYEGCGYLATFSYYPDGRLGEVFLDTGKINTPQEVLAVCVLLDYGAGKMFPVPLPVNATPMSKTELASHMAGQRLGSIPWLQLLNLLIPLLQQWLANNP